MLDDAYDDAQDAALTLREQLRASERAAGSLLSGGSLASVSKNSASHSYAYGRGNITAAETARGWRILIDTYDQVIAAFGVAGLATNDASVVAEMRLRLQPIREFTKDYTGLCQ
jgi:hypothetical protein